MEELWDQPPPCPCRTLQSTSGGCCCLSESGLDGTNTNLFRVPDPNCHTCPLTLRPQPSSVPGGGRDREVDSPLTLASSGIAEGGVPTRKAPFLLPPPFHTLSRVLPGAAPQALPPPSPKYTFSSSRWAETAKLGQKPPPLTPVLWEIGR